MIIPLVQRRDSHFDFATLDSKTEIAESRDGDPKSLMGLLQRAADMWPANGIALKDKGWNKESTFITYETLVKEAKVKTLSPNDTDLADLLRTTQQSFLHTEL